jgi:hypothetical protein
MALAIPGGAPGYDEDKQFGNNITHVALRLPEGCADHSARPRKVKVKATREAIMAIIARFGASGECFSPTAVMARARSETIQAVIPGRCEASNPEPRDSGFAPTRAPE